LVGFVLLVMVAVTALFDPLATCPECQGKDEAYGESDYWWRALHHLPERLTLYQRWSDKWGC